LQVSHGEGTNQDPEALCQSAKDHYKSGHKAKAAELFSQAVAQGHAEAQYSLGYMYYKGEGVPQDNARGLALLQQSAAQGFEPAQEVLAQIARAAGNAKKPSAAVEAAENNP
jgi:TPR repeat protein